MNIVVMLAGWLDIKCFLRAARTPDLKVGRTAPELILANRKQEPAKLNLKT